MKQYRDLATNILLNGEYTPDRTGTGTYSVFGHQMRFNLRRGFPLVTLKKTFWRGAFVEMLWFLRGDTNEAWLSSRGVNIWREWMGRDHQLFDIYGKQMRRFEVPNPSVELVELRAPSDGSPEGTKRRFDIVDPTTVDAAKRTGETVQSNKCGPLRLLDRTAEGEYRAQFLDTGFVTEIARPAATKVHDPYRPSYAGVGFEGEPHRPYSAAEKDLWRGVIKRCYLQTSTSYCNYGAKGCTVDRRWHCFANFLEDVSTLPGYEAWLRNPGAYHLDKDYYGANQYGPRLCVFLSASQNGALSGTAVELDGVKYLSMREAARATERSHKQITAMGATKLEAPEGYAYRRVFFVDQLEALAKGLKEAPHSRRHVINLWNPADAERAALPACHVLAQFHVSADNRLSCQVYQRSADVFLGVPFNIAGYALLTHLLAHHCHMGVGDLVWTGGDCHLYSNHIEQTIQMLDREPNGLSHLTLLHKHDKPLWEVEPDDLSVTNYHPHPAIKGEVAI